MQLLPMETFVLCNKTCMKLVKHERTTRRRRRRKSEDRYSWKHDDRLFKEKQPHSQQLVQEIIGHEGNE